ncbi:hypothetical protein WR25_11426, partial [Diploscapter pachys]
VRAGKNYVCRYEQKCRIDKAGRNVCRSCRFQKCLEVGMEPDAIRPDRDKTGRQKNPRRNGSHNYDLVKKISVSSLIGDLPSVNKMREDSDDMPTSPSSRADSAPLDMRPSPIDESVLTTLKEIEAICVQLRDASPITPQPRPSLSEAVIRPSLITPRTHLLFDGSKGPANLPIISENIRRMVVLVFDYVNTLKPIADMNVEEKLSLIRNCVIPYTLLVTGHQTVKQESMNENIILLPSGHTFGTETLLFSSNQEDDKRNLLLDAKVDGVRRNMLDHVVHQMRKVQVTDTELVALKAIMALDPNIKGLSVRSSALLLVARESVQNALFTHLLTRFSHNEATARFGHLLLLIASATRVAASMAALLQLSKDIQIAIDPVIEELILYDI